MSFISAVVGVALTTLVQANESLGCQTLCPLSYAPICATDDSGNTQTFPNACALRTENCLKKQSKVFFLLSISNNFLKYISSHFPILQIFRRQRMDHVPRKGLEEAQ